MLRHAVSSNKFALVCSKRPKCYARGYIAVVGDSIKIVKKGLTYTVDADEEDLLKIENYGETLLHTHTAHCKGRSFFAIFFFKFYQRKMALSAVLLDTSRHVTKKGRHSTDGFSDIQ